MKIAGMKIAVVVQARMGSSRLPGKVMLPVAGAPLLERMLERVRASAEADEVCVATTTHPEDEPIRALGTRLGVRVVSGHPTDLIDRHLLAGRACGADAVAKVPSDCPLIDPDIIDTVLRRFRSEHEQYDFVTNLNPPSWPDGNDVEVMPMSVLEVAFREAQRRFEREHTTPFIWDNPERFRLLNVTSSLGRDLSSTHRFTIDYPEDYQFICRVYDELWSAGLPAQVFRLAAILELLERCPDIMQLNARWSGTSWHLSHLQDLRSVALGAAGLTWKTG